MNEVAALLARAYTTTDHQELQAIHQHIETGRNNPEMTQCFMAIMANHEFPEPVRISACIQIKIDIERFWTPDSDVPYHPGCRQLLITNLPEMLVSSPPFIKPALTYLAEIVVSRCEAEEWPNLLEIIASLLGGTVEAVAAGLTLLKGFLKREWMMGCHSERIRPEVVAFCGGALGPICHWFAETGEMQLRVQILGILRKMIKLSANFLDVLDFGFWGMSVNIAAQATVFDEHCACFLRRVVKIYSDAIARHADVEIPNSFELVQVGFDLLLHRTWTCNTMKCAIGMFKYLRAGTQNGPLWARVMSEIAGLFQNCIFQFYQLQPDLAAMADTDPKQFTLDLPMSEFEPHISAMARKEPAICELLIRVGASVIEDFTKDGNDAKLFGALQLVASGWDSCWRNFAPIVTEFLGKAATVLADHPSTLAQSSFLVLLHALYPWQSEWMPDPQHLFLAITKLSSDRPLIVYYATSVVERIITKLSVNVMTQTNEITSMMDAESALELRGGLEVQQQQILDFVHSQMTPETLALMINAILQVADAFGRPELIIVLSYIIKDEFFIYQIVAEAGNLINSIVQVVYRQTIDDSGTGKIDAPYDALLNLMKLLSPDPEKQKVVCGHIFAFCKQEWSVLVSSGRQVDKLIEILNSIAMYAPENCPEIWTAVNNLLPICLQEGDMYNMSALLHNIMLIDQDTVRAEWPRFVELGMNLLSEMYSETVVGLTVNSAIVAIAEPGTLPDEYLQALIPYTCSFDWRDNTYDLESISHMYISFAKFAPELLAGCMLPYFSVWITGAQSAHVGYALSRCCEHLPGPLLDEMLRAELTSERPPDDDEIDVDQENFENEMGAVEMELIPPISNDECRALFRAFLEHILASNPEYGVGIGIPVYLSVGQAEEPEEEDDD